MQQSRRFTYRRWGGCQVRCGSSFVGGGCSGYTIRSKHGDAWISGLRHRARHLSGSGVYLALWHRLSGVQGILTDHGLSAFTMNLPLPPSVLIQFAPSDKDLLTQVRHVRDELRLRSPGVLSVPKCPKSQVHRCDDRREFRNGLQRGLPPSFRKFRHAEGLPLYTGVGGGGRKEVGRAEATRDRDSVEGGSWNGGGGALERCLPAWRGAICREVTSRLPNDTDTIMGIGWRESHLLLEAKLTGHVENGVCSGIPF
jgi:hypothetical protein